MIYTFEFVSSCNQYQAHQIGLAISQEEYLDAEEQKIHPYGIKLATSVQLNKDEILTAAQKFDSVCNDAFP